MNGKWRHTAIVLTLSYFVGASEETVFLEKNREKRALSSKSLLVDVSHKLADYASNELANQFTYVPWPNFVGPSIFDVNEDGFPDMLYHHHIDQSLFFPGSAVGSYWDLAISVVDSNNIVTYNPGKVDVTYKATILEDDATAQLDGNLQQDISKKCVNNLNLVDGSIVDDVTCLGYPDFHGFVALDFDRDGILDAFNAIGGGGGKGVGPGIESMLFWGDDATPSNETESMSNLQFTGGRSAFLEAGFSTGEPQRSYGLYPADFNNDGYLDVFMMNRYRKEDTRAPGHIFMSRGASEPRRFDVHPEVSEFSKTALLTDFDQDGFANEFLILQEACVVKGADCIQQPRCVVYKWDASLNIFVKIWASSLFENQTELISSASGDFNGDGLTDVVVLLKRKFEDGSTKGELLFWYSSQEGQLLGSSELRVEIPSDCKPRHSLRAADFDLNGSLDLLIVCQDGTNVVFIQSNNGKWLAIDSAFLGPLGDKEQIAAPSEAFYERCFGDNLDQCEIDDPDYVALLKNKATLPNGELDLPVPSGQGVTVFDYNNDGFMDIFLAVKGGLNMLFENKGVPGKRLFLSFQLKGTTSNLNGIGAIVLLRWKGGVNAGKRIQLREHNYIESDPHGSRDSRIIFGLGATGVPLELKVRWPSGKVSILTKEMLSNMPMTMNYNEITTITEPE